MDAKLRLPPQGQDALLCQNVDEHARNFQISTVVAAIAFLFCFEMWIDMLYDCAWLFYERFGWLVSLLVYALGLLFA